MKGLGERIKSYREKNNILTEDLESKFNITKKDMMLWELEKKEPSISEIKKLSKAFKITVDELLAVEDRITIEEISQIKAELINIGVTKGFYEMRKVSEEYINKYSDSYLLKLNIAMIIENSVYINKDSKTIEDVEYILELYKAVEIYGDFNSIQKALFAIGEINDALGNYRESKRAFNKLIDGYYSPIINYAGIYVKENKSKEAREICQKNLLKHINESIALLTVLSGIEIDRKNYDKSNLYLEGVNELENRYDVGLNSSVYNIYKNNIERGDVEEAANWFEKYTEQLINDYYEDKKNAYFDELNLEDKEWKKEIIVQLAKELANKEEESRVMGVNEKYNKAIKRLKKFYIKNKKK